MTPTAAGDRVDLHVVAQWQGRVVHVRRAAQPDSIRELRPDGSAPWRTGMTIAGDAATRTPERGSVAERMCETGRGGWPIPSDRPRAQRQPRPPPHGRQEAAVIGCRDSHRGGSAAGRRRRRRWCTCTRAATRRHRVRLPFDEIVGRHPCASRTFPPITTQRARAQKSLARDRALPKSCASSPS